jgi:hypothetical protein
VARAFIAAQLERTVRAYRRVTTEEARDLHEAAYLEVFWEPDGSLAIHGRLAPEDGALRARDPGCRFPGCENRRFLDAHHVHHWARGGPTTMENLLLLCRRHHRLVHEGGYRVDRHGRSK